MFTKQYLSSGFLELYFIVMETTLYFYIVKHSPYNIYLTYLVLKGSTFTLI